MAGMVRWPASLLIVLQGAISQEPLFVRDDANAAPLFPQQYLHQQHESEDERPVMRVAGIFSPQSADGALAFLLALEQANDQMKLPVRLKSATYWQNDSDDSLQYFQTACDISEAGALAVVGPPFSTETASMENVFSALAVPVLGTSATDPGLRRYSNFLRLVPDDHQQSDAMAAVMQHFNWTRVATVYQMDSYGEDGLERFFRWALAAKGKILRIPIKSSSDNDELECMLGNIKDRRYNIIVSNICCDHGFIAKLAGVADNLGLFDPGYFWLFSDGVTNFMDTGDLSMIMPQIGQKPGLFGVLMDIKDRLNANHQLVRTWAQRNLQQVPGAVSVYTATTYDAVTTLAQGLAGLPVETLEIIAEPQKCLNSHGRRQHSVPGRRKNASQQLLHAMTQVEFVGCSGSVSFNSDGSRAKQHFKILNIMANGTATRMGTVDADTGKLFVEKSFKPLFLGEREMQPADVPARELQQRAYLGVLMHLLLPACLILGCLGEVLWKVLGDVPEREPMLDSPRFGHLRQSSPSRGGCLNSLRAGVGEPEPVQLCPPVTLKKPIVVDIIAGGVKAMVELVSCLTFAALMTPDELQPYLHVFLNYALFGFIVSQIYYNLVSKYMAPVRTCNMSAAVFFLQVLAGCRTTLMGVHNQLEVTVNTLLMAATISTWLSGTILWVVGTFKLTSFVRYLSEPVKLGMQVSLGYFLFATSFSICTGVSWLDFTDISQFSVYAHADIFPKWSLTALCAGVVFWILNKSGWPYTIPLFVGLGIAVFHVVLYLAGFSIDEAKNAGWLYPPPTAAEGNTNPFSFIFRIYDMHGISWRVLICNFPAILTASLVAPFLSAIINLILFETTFPAELFGRSTLSYEVRLDGTVQWLLAAVGGYSTSPSCGGAAVYWKVGARSNWGLYTSCAMHAAFLLLPGSTEMLRYIPKFVVGAVSLLVSISLLDSGLRGSYSKLSKREYGIVWLTLLMSAALGLQTGIAAGWVLSFLLFIGIVAARAPVRLDVDAGLVSSHAVWGARSASIVAQLRGAVRMLNFQGVLFFSAMQPTLQEAKRKYLQGGGRALFFILDFSSVTGMDDSSPFEFKSLASAAKAAGVSVLISGCGKGLLEKLHRVGVLPQGDETVHLSESVDLLPAAQRTAKAGTWHIYVVHGGADRAVEFCEIALALRTLDLCQDVVPKPQRELQTLATLVEGELSRYCLRLQPGEQFERTEGGIAILVEGAIQAVANLRQVSVDDGPRPEVIVVYRTLPGLDRDYCFIGSTPGTLRALTVSLVIQLPQGALSELRQSERWADVEAVWSQLAEFMASSMHSMAMKATMQDVCGAYSSRAADTYLEAMLEQEQTEGWSPLGDSEEAWQRQSNFLRRLLIGDDELQEMRQNAGGRVFGAPPQTLESLKRQVVQHQQAQGNKEKEGGSVV